MKIYTDISEFKPCNFAVATVGTFDGLHIGHKKIINRMKAIATENDGETILVTFDPHPRLVVDGYNSEIKFINTQKRKFRLLDKYGIDHLIIIPFTHEFSQTSSTDFIKNYLVNIIGVKKLIVGYDHHFGKGRDGDYQMISQLGKQYGYDVEEVSAEQLNGIPVSSTKIRYALMHGDIWKANTMLGYEYSITGVVVVGNKIGRKIGFPTANIDIEDKFKLVAAGGVYACKAEIDGNIYFGMGNIGTRPTVGINGLVTEIHIFDFDEDIYGKEITIFFIDRIRDEIKFANLDKLKEQLKLDEEKVRRLFNLKVN